PIPAVLHLGRFGRNRRRLRWGSLFAGSLCLMLAPVPMVQTLGLYVLPLQYLRWIGLGLVALGAGAFLLHLLVRGPFRYVQDGIPLVVRIRELVMRCTAMYDGQPSTYRLLAVIEYRDPDIGGLS